MPTHKLGLCGGGGDAGCRYQYCSNFYLYPVILCISYEVIAFFLVFANCDFSYIANTLV